MLRTIVKLYNNLNLKRVVSTLGFKNSLLYLWNFAKNLPKVIISGDFLSIDQIVGQRVKRFTYRKRHFTFDCAFCDAAAQEESFAFGIARELYIKDCYFKWSPEYVFDRAKIVVDLGANRGGFSALMTTQASFVLSVECQSQYAPMIRHNFSENQFSSYAIETVYVGSGGKLDQADYPTLSIEELLARHGIGQVDLMKLDIEGSEFVLFESPEWLRRVNALSMEVHKSFGEIGQILSALDAHGFMYALADDILLRVQDPARANLVYAWK